VSCHPVPSHFALPLANPRRPPSRESGERVVACMYWVFAAAATAAATAALRCTSVTPIQFPSPTTSPYLTPPPNPPLLPPQPPSSSPLSSPRSTPLFLPFFLLQLSFFIPGGQLSSPLDHFPARYACGTFVSCGQHNLGAARILSPPSSASLLALPRGEIRSPSPQFAFLPFTAALRRTLVTVKVDNSIFLFPPHISHTRHAVVPF
jgi:hypothetical protein